MSPVTRPRCSWRLHRVTVVVPPRTPSTGCDIAVDDLPGDAAGQLAELRAHTGLKLPDCCVLLTAERHGPAEIATFDTRLARVAVERGLVVRPDA